MFARLGIKNVNARFTKFVKEERVLAVVAVIALIFAVFNYADAGKVSDIKKRIRRALSPRPFVLSPAASEIKNNIFYSPLETVVVSGPAANSRVENTRVEFVLDGWQLVPHKKTDRFQVWLIGFDATWEDSGSRVVYDLPPGIRIYTLLARAKNGAGEYDTTPAVRTFGLNTSPYFGKVDITGVSYRGDFKRSHYEKISIQNSFLDAPVNVSGWKIATKRFNFSFEMPRAASVFNPRDLSANDPIVLGQGNSVDIYVGKRSPLGVNFEENFCTSFFSGAFEGYDALSGYGSCPAPDPSSYNQYSVDCRSFIRGLSSCREPQLAYYQFINEPPCREFIIKNFNYQSCVERARGKVDFYSGRWKVYLGRSEEILDDLNDEVYLYDNQGLLVDKYNY